MFKPIPIVQAGGMQPYEGSTPQAPGMALAAMLRGTMGDGSHPADAMRMVQRQARQRPRSLLDTLVR
jgi:hypothetical protein